MSKEIGKYIFNLYSKSPATLIDNSSYKINDLSDECECLILDYFDDEMTNLPITLEEIYINESHLDDLLDTRLVKIPFGCEIKTFQKIKIHYDF